MKFLDSRLNIYTVVTSFTLFILLIVLYKTVYINIFYIDNFEYSLNYALEHEGEYVDNPVDKGGKTKYGIAQKFHPKVDIQNLSLKEASAIYRKDYWLPIYDKILSVKIAAKLFDAGVLMGTKKAIILLQRALLSTGVDLVLDGEFGKKTLKLVNNCNNTTGLLWAFTSEISAYLTDIAEDDPTQRIFLQGWLNRAYDQPK